MKTKKFIVAVVVICFLVFLVAFSYLNQSKFSIEKLILDNMDKSQIYEKIEAGCEKKISENSEFILKFMKENLLISKDGVSKNDVSNLFCIDCLKAAGALRNKETNNIEISYTYHNRYFSDRSFDEWVVCEVKTNFEVVKLLVSAEVRHAS